MLQNSIYLSRERTTGIYSDFFARGTSLCSPKSSFEAMPEQKQHRVERLVLGRGRDIALNRKIGEIFLDVGRRQLLRRFVAQKTLKLTRPGA